MWQRRTGITYFYGYGQGFGDRGLLTVVTLKSNAMFAVPYTVSRDRGVVAKAER